jgi:hypothetical protein
VPTYLVEGYVSRSQAQHAHEAGRRARAAAEALSSEGAPIRYVRATFLPDDETCFHLFEADSIELVEEASRRAALGRTRVVPAVDLPEPAESREET